MPDTPATRMIVTKNYDLWQKRLTQFNDKVPGITKADVDSAKAKMSAAITEWLAPGPAETPKQAKEARKKADGFISKFRSALKRGK